MKFGGESAEIYTIKLKSIHFERLFLVYVNDRRPHLSLPGELVPLLGEPDQCVVRPGQLLPQQPGHRPRLPVLVLLARRHRRDPVRQPGRRLMEVQQRPAVLREAAPGQEGRGGCRVRARAGRGGLGQGGAGLGGRVGLGGRGGLRAGLVRILPFQYDRGETLLESVENDKVGGEKEGDEGSCELLLLFILEDDYLATQFTIFGVVHEQEAVIKLCIAD